MAFFYANFCALIIDLFLYKCVDGLDRTNSLGSDLEKNQHSSRSVPVTEPSDAGGSNHKENHYSGVIGIEGCSSSIASQLLNDRMYFQLPLGKMFC